MYENKIKRRAIKSVFSEWWSGDWIKIKDAYKNEFISCIQKIVVIPLLFIRIFGLFNIFYILIWKLLKAIFANKFPLECDQKTRNAIDIYVLLSFSLLIVLLFMITTLPQNFIKCILLLFMCWRVIEIIDYQLCIVLIDNKEGKIKTFTFERSVILFLFNFCEIVVFYSILYLNFGLIKCCYNNQVVEKPFDALYFSLGIITTTGLGDIIPINYFGKKLVFWEIITGLVLLIVFFGIFVSKWKRE